MNSDDFNDKLYLRELLTQCKFSLKAINYLESALNRNDGKFDNDDVWYHAQMFLVSAGNVSKMVYSNPSNKKLQKYVAHHSRIAEEYKLPKVDFRAELNLRNYYEHYDEKLVDWIENTPSNVAKMLNNIGSLNDFITGMNFSYLKHLDTSSNTLHLLDRSIDFSNTYYKLISLEKHIQEILSVNHG